MKVKKDMIDKEIRARSHLFFFLKTKNEKTFNIKYKFYMKLCRFLLKNHKVKGVKNEKIYIDSKHANRKIKVSIYRPLDVKDDEILPAVLWTHGGGYAIGLSVNSACYIRDLIKTKKCVVISPDYTLSFEEPYPAALNDVIDTLLYMKEHSNDLHIRDNNFIIGGESAGAGLASALSFYTRDNLDIKIAFQMILYPMINDKMDTESMKDNDAPVWNEKLNRFAWKKYLGDLYGKDDVPYYASTMRASDFSNLPPTISYVGDIDPFRDDAINFIAKLKEENIETRFELYKGGYHAFDSLCPKAKISGVSRRFLLNSFSEFYEKYVELVKK